MNQLFRPAEYCNKFDQRYKILTVAQKDVVEIAYCVVLVSRCVILYLLSDSQDLIVFTAKTNEITASQMSI